MAETIDGNNITAPLQRKRCDFMLANRTQCPNTLEANSPETFCLLHQQVQNQESADTPSDNTMNRTLTQNPQGEPQPAK